MVRRLIRFTLIAAASIAAAIAFIAIVARFSDGPIAVFPGGPLGDGTPTDYGSVNWNELTDVREIEFQLETPPRSRTTRMIIYNGRPYIPCAFCTNRLLKRWPRELERDDRVILRIKGMLIQGRAHRVPNGSEEYVAARRAHASKYVAPTSVQNSVEDQAAQLVVGAARTAPGKEGEAVPDSWLYRIDPR